MNVVNWFETDEAITFTLGILLAVVLVYWLARICGPQGYFSRDNAEGWLFLLLILFFMDFFISILAYGYPESWAGPIFSVGLLLLVISMVCLAFVAGSRHR